MSFADNGDDELDYEDEDYPGEEPGHAGYGHSGGAIGALAEDDAEEYDYEDLYDDVDVGLLGNSEVGGGGGGQAAGRFPDGVDNGVDNGGEEYGEEEDTFAEYARPGGHSAGGARALEEEAYAADAVAAQSARSERNLRQKTEGEYGGPHGEDKKMGEGSRVKEEQIDDVVPEEAAAAAELGDDLSAPMAAADADRGDGRQKQQPDTADAIRATGAAGSGNVKTEADGRDYGEGDAHGGKGGTGPVVALLKAKVEGDGTVGNGAQRAEPQVGRPPAADRKSAAWARNGSANSDGGRAGARAEGSGGSGRPAGSSEKSRGGSGSDHGGTHGSSHQQHESSTGIMLFVGELHWWTTDAELEAALSDYGRVKNVKFFEEKASGRSKGYCQVEFYDAGAARACKEKMDGRVFNDRACVVAFASPMTIKQMGAAQVGKNQMQSHGSAGGSGRGGRGESGGRGGGAGAQMGEGGRGGYGREKMSMGGGGRAGGGPGERGRGSSGRSRGGSMGGRGGGGGGGAGGGGGSGGGGHFAQGPPGGPMGGVPGGMMPPGGMMGGFDPAFGPPMGGRGGGGGYGMGPGGPGGGFGPRAHPFGGGPGMGPPFPTMGPGLPGVAPHVNPAFFGRANGSGPGMGMDGPAGAWGEGPMPGWVGDDHERRMVYGDEMGGPDYGYPGEMGPDRMRAVRERDGGGEWVDRRRREDRGDRGDRGARDEYWEREQVREKDKDWLDRERVPRGREKARAAASSLDDEDRSRSREEDFGKRRRMMSDRKIDR